MKLTALIVAAVLGLLTLSARAAEDPRITPYERAKLIKYLQDSQREFEALLADVNETQWRWKPAPERWSVAETAQHIVIAENLLFSLANQAMSNPADPEWETKTGEKTALLERALPDRSHKVQAPEPLDPTKITMTREQALAAFRERRARTVQFAETTQLPLREHLTKGLFPIFDPLNAYQFVLYIPLHNIRHNQQIAEVKATAGYPRQ